jgi:hypothetical protein
VIVNQDEKGTTSKWTAGQYYTDYGSKKAKKKANVWLKGIEEAEKVYAEYSPKRLLAPQSLQACSNQWKTVQLFVVCEGRGLQPQQQYLTERPRIGYLMGLRGRVQIQSSLDYLFRTMFAYECFVS